MRLLTIISYSIIKSTIHILKYSKCVTGCCCLALPVHIIHKYLKKFKRMRPVKGSQKLCLAKSQLPSKKVVVLFLNNFPFLMPAIFEVVVKDLVFWFLPPKSYTFFGGFFLVCIPNPIKFKMTNICFFVSLYFWNLKKLKHFMKSLFKILQTHYIQLHK